MTIRLSDYLETNKKSQDKIFTAKSIAAHNKKNDCYIGLNGKVYNIGKYSTDLQNSNKKRNLNVICGSILDTSIIDIFKTDDYTKYEIGVIQYYLFKKIVKLIFIFILYIISIYFSFVVKSKIRIFFILYLLIITYIIVRWLLKTFNYTSSVQVQVQALL